MDVPKVPPRQAAVDQLQEVLESPEVARLVRTLQLVRWTGRPGYPVRAMVGMCLVKSLYAIPTWSRAVRLVAEHDGLQRVLGCAPSQWACYRFAKTLQERDNWTLQQCLTDVLQALQREHPTMGQNIAIDGSDLPAYANGHDRRHDGTTRKPSDPDATWGRRSGVSTRNAGPFYGYKIHAAVDTATDLPLAWTVAPGNAQEQHFAIGLLDKTRQLGFDPQTAIMDKGYDTTRIHWECDRRGIAPVIPLIERHWDKRRGSKPRGDEPPHCAHGEWTFAGADYKRRATKWRCPTGQCEAKSMWVRASRLQPIIPRQTKKYHDLYASRGSVEREFGRLKHEWSLLPLRVRGIGRVQLHADLTILACLTTRLARARSLPLAA